MGDVLMIVSQCLYMGVVTFAPATAMEAATGFPFEASIVLSIVVATFYTSIGGMKAVVWTDALQGTIYLVGIIVILVEGISAVGGLDKVWEINQNGGRLDAWVFDPNIFEYRMTFWGILIGGFISAVNAMGATQTSIQRYCALPSLNKAKLSVILLTPFQIVMISLSFLIGMVVYAYFEITGCDPLRSGVIGNANQLLPHFIMEVVNIPGIPGLFFAVLYCGSLSSLSSSLSALSAVTWTDMLESRFSHLPEERKAFLTKTLASGYGLVAIAIAFAVEGMGVHVAQASSSLVMSATGPLLGMFVCGFFLPWVNGKGAVGGAIFGLAMMIWTSMGANITAPYINHLPTIETNCTVNTTLAPIPDNKDAFFLYKLSYLWYDAMGMTLTVLAAIIITFFTGPFKPSSVDPRLVIPIFDRLVCCLPESVQKKLWCGVKHDQVEDFIQEEIKKDVELKNTTNGSTSIRGHKVAPLPPQIFRDSKVDILAPDFTQQRVISHIPESLP